MSRVLRYLLLCTLICVIAIPASGQNDIKVDIGSEEIRIAAEKEALKRERERRRRLKKLEKKSSRLKKLKNLADSLDFAGYMIQMQSVEVVGDETPAFPVYATLKEARRAFQQPEFSGGYFRLRNNIHRRFRQPDDSQNALGVFSWGDIVVRFILDKDGNVIKAKTKTHISPAIDEEIEQCVMSLPRFHPAKFGGKYFNAIGTMTIGYEYELLENEEREKLRRKGVDIGDSFTYFKLDEVDIVWTPGITTIL